MTIGAGAGDGGFDVQVGGNTDLKGGAITSTQAAIDQDLNRFETATLTLSDIENKASFSAKAIGVSAGTGANNLGGALKPSGTSIGFGQDSGNASSTTQAAISGIAGNTNARTGDKETGIQKIFDADKVQKEIDAQVIITQTFGREAPRAAADFAQTLTKPYTDAQLLKASAESQLNITTDPQQREALLKTIDQTNQTLDANQAQYDLWKEGGAYRVALQTVVGGLGGGLSGALGAGATAAAVPVLNELQGSIVQKLKDAGASDAVANLAGQAVSLTAAAGIGAAAGGGNAAGIASGFNVDANNRQLHETELKRIKQLAGGDKVKEERLQAAACALTRCADGVPTDDPNYAFLRALQIKGAEFQEEQILLDQQTGQVGRAVNQRLFQYSWVDEFILDPATQNKIGTRLAGTGQAVAGGLGVAGSAGACTTGVGCAVGAVTGTVSADYAIAGVKQAVSGNAQTPYGEQVLQALGLSPQTSALTYAALGLAPAGVEGIIANKAVNQSIALNDAARLSYTTEKFTPRGLNVTQEVLNSPQAKAIINEYVITGLNSDEAARYAKTLISSGKALPTELPVTNSTELIKLVPRGVPVGDTGSAYSPFFVTRQQYDALIKLPPNKIADQLGLPAEQAIRGTQLGFDAYAIKPLPGVTAKAFISEIAPVKQGEYAASGGAQQVLVPNRQQWTDPNANKIGSIPGIR